MLISNPKCQEIISIYLNLVFLFFRPSSFRYGDGYTIILRLADTESNPDSCPVSSCMKSSFPSIELKERHHNVLQFQLPSHACCLARVFHVLANDYEELGISDFSVSQDHTGPGERDDRTTFFISLDFIQMNRLLLSLLWSRWKRSKQPIVSEISHHHPDPP